MSSSSEYSGFSGNQPAKSPEKSTFSQTCSLLSQYLKEKGNFGDLTLGITNTVETNGSPETSCHSATTMDLFPTYQTPQNLTTMNFFPPRAAYPCHSEVPTLVNSSAFKATGKDSKAAQLTIFYAGQVIVYDDFPAEKLEEIMTFARKGSSQGKNSPAYSCVQNQPQIVPNIIPQTPSRLCELPIARKASLHRFLEKRKDRIASKAPYQTSNRSSVSDKPAESVPWLGLGAKFPNQQ